MGKKFTESRTFNIILSILVAMGLWVYVTTVVNNEGAVPVRNLPVSVLGEDVLRGKGFMIDPGVKLTVNLRLTGSRTALANITANISESLTATIDVSAIDEAGSYELPVKVTPRNTLTGSVTVENRNNLTLTVSISTMMEKTLDVRTAFTGTVPEGYRSNPAEITPSTVQIQGPESVVSQIQYARVNIDGNGLTKTFSGDLSFDYVTAEGQKVVSADIVSNVDAVNVILPIVKTLDVPLDVEFAYGGGITKENFDRYVTYTIEPASIQISGDEADVDPLESTSIKLGTVIDLASFTESQTYQIPIALDPGLTNDSGISQATVTVKISGLETKVLETQNIDVINVPEPYAASVVTQTLQVKVRGPADALVNIDGYQLRAVVDLKDESLRKAQFPFQARIYLDGDESCGVVTGKNDYIVVVNIE